MPTRGRGGVRGARAMSAAAILALLTLSIPAFGAATPAAGTAAPPLVVDADQSTAVNAPDSNSGHVTYTGHVVITRGVTRIHGEHAVVYTQGRSLIRAVVTGSPATFSWQGKSGRPVHGQALAITYRAADDTVELTGSVVVTRGKERFSAAHAVYALRTQTLTAHGSNSERVHAVFPPAATTGGS